MNKLKPLLIGIAGGSGSGKTTFSNYLFENLSQFSVRVIEMDRYYKSERPITVSPLNGKVYEDFNHPNSVNIDKVLNEISEVINEGITDVLIIEGFLLFNFAELMKQLDLKVYIDCPPDERLLRRIDNFSNWGIPKDEISEYISIVRNRHDEYVEPTRWYADIVMNGLSKTEKSKCIIVEWITNRIRKL